jgi:hypothetical protein
LGIAWDAAALDRVADGLLVAIRRGRIEQAIPDAQCVGDGPLALREVRDLEDAETEERHLDSVVEGDGRNLGRRFVG